MPKSLLIFIFLFACFCDIKAQENCDFKTSDGGIEVYLCETEDSPFKTISVNFTVNATLKEYASGVLDIANYPKWQSNILQPHVLEQKSENELIYYCEVDTPWPITHRDLIFKLNMKQDPTTKVIHATLTQLPNYLPEKEDIVRIPKANSTLTVTPLGKDRLKVNYTMHIDIGGYVPPFIVNLFATQTPWNTFNNYRNRLESGAVSGTGASFIQNY